MNMDSQHGLSNLSKPSFSYTILQWFYLACNKIAWSSMKNGPGPWIDVVFYLLDAMRLFREKSMEWYSRSPSRSGCMDSTGWTSSTLNRRTSCGVVAGEDVLGATTRLHHICRLQEKRIEPRIGVDLGEEREMAEEIGEEKKRIE